MKRHLILAALLCAPFQASAVHADLVVVVGERSTVTALERADVVNIYMGRYRRLPDGQAAHPLDMPSAALERARFYQHLLGKSPQEINAYWARLVFSGRTTPPQELESSEAVQSRLEQDPQAIGYVEREHVTRHMRVLLALPD